MGAHGLDVAVRRERAERGLASGIQLEKRAEEAMRSALEDDADVQLLAALDTRDESDDRVLEGLKRHDAPPRPR
jgi:hypothetical protein